ncbi:GNAT family N-acetyltransferase [Glutamicibacter sp. TV12E]|uniref:GNAT family N-acetyltransferase n=1 Tax=Glutamicibacter sp. TV12E TaxID=3446362 RepID=UPI0040335AB8
MNESSRKIVVAAHDPDTGFNGPVPVGPTHHCRLSTLESEHKLVPPSLEMRPFHAADAEFFAALASDERVVRFIGFGQPWNQQDIDSCVEAAMQNQDPMHVGTSRWFVATMAKQPVGLIFSTRQESSIEIGYWVSPAHWGRGVGGEMLNRTMAMVPGLFGATTLSASVAPGNSVSATLLANRGFILKARTDELDQYLFDVRSQ